MSHTRVFVLHTSGLFEVVPLTQSLRANATDLTLDTFEFTTNNPNGYAAFLGSAKLTLQLIALQSRPRSDVVRLTALMRRLFTCFPNQLFGPSDRITFARVAGVCRARPSHNGVFMARARHVRPAQTCLTAPDLFYGAPQTLPLRQDYVQFKTVCVCVCGR